MRPVGIVSGSPATPTTLLYLEVKGGGGGRGAGIYFRDYDYIPQSTAVEPTVEEQLALALKASRYGFGRADSRMEMEPLIPTPEAKALEEETLARNEQLLKKRLWPVRRCSTQG